VALGLPAGAGWGMRGRRTLESGTDARSGSGPRNQPYRTGPRRLVICPALVLRVARYGRSLLAPAFYLRRRDLESTVDET